MSFYRKYRPQTLSEIDTVKVKEKLKDLLGKEKDKLPHAYIFYGPKGTGKTTAARLVAKIFNCTDLSQTGPCGKCSQCKSIETGVNMDVQEIDAASNRGIDEIRQLRERIGYAPAGGEFNVYIIDEVHMLTTEAFNGLLKTLEEPPRHAVFVLATTEIWKVPETIRSRCTQIAFQKATDKEISQALSRIIKKEKIDVSPDALSEIIRYADGSYRDAVKVLEQLNLKKAKISLKEVQEGLSLTESDGAVRFLEAVAGSDMNGLYGIIDDLNASGHDFKVFICDILMKLRNELRHQASGTPGEIKWEKKHDLRDLIRRLILAYGELKYTPITSLPLELSIIEYFQATDNQVFHDPVKDDPGIRKKSIPEKQVTPKNPEKVNPPDPAAALNLITLEKLTDCWKDIIEEVKPYNHSVAGILRSARPLKVSPGTVTIEAFYKFHQEKLSEPKVKDVMSGTLKKLFGEKVKVEFVLGKK